MTTTENAVDRVPWLKWIDRFSLLLAVLGGIAAVGLMVNIVLDVVGRFFFSRPLPGTLDMTQFAWMPILVSFGLGYALLRAEHIRVNLLTAPTGSRTQRIIEIVGMVFALVTTAMFIWFGTAKASEAMNFNEKAVGTQWLEVWPFRFAVVIGMIGLLLQAFATLLRAITVKEFVPADDDEAISALEAEETVFEELNQADPAVVRAHAANGDKPATSERTETR